MRFDNRVYKVQYFRAGKPGKPPDLEEYTMNFWYVDPNIEYSPYGEPWNEDLHRRALTVSSRFVQEMNRI